jgi:hypothetical protein
MVQGCISEERQGSKYRTVYFSPIRDILFAFINK